MVKIGRNELKSTVETETTRQLEIYISNARTRMKRTAIRVLSRSINESSQEDSESVLDLSENDQGIE